MRQFDLVELGFNVDHRRWIVQLSRLTNLQYLTLDGTAITDAGLKRLEGMTRLSTLNVRRTRVTKTGAQHLKATLEAAPLRIATTPGLVLQVNP